MLVTLLLLACNSDGMPACPSAPGGDPGASLLAERSIDTLGDAVPDQIEVFHDQESLNAWWASTWPYENAPEMDFTSAQAIGLVTRG